MNTLRFRGGPWFNDPPNSVKSCCAFNSVATEFQCQGLELDLPIVCWDDDVLWNDGWKTKKKTREVEILFNKAMVSALILKPKENEAPRVDYLKLPILDFLAEPS